MVSRLSTWEVEKNNMFEHFPFTNNLFKLLDFQYHHIIFSWFTVVWALKTHISKTLGQDEMIQENKTLEVISNNDIILLKYPKKNY